VNEAMRAELADIQQQAQARLPYVLDYHYLVIDIGANDGTLLSHYKQGEDDDQHPLRIAFEPALNLRDALDKHTEVSYADFFPGEQSAQIASGGISIITSIAMFYDLDDPIAFVREIDRLLTQDGVWVVQFQDLAQQIETNAFDNFCFEHRGYYSLQTFMQTLVGTNLHVVDVERRAINGGSLRITVQRQHRPVSPVVAQLLAREAAWTSRRALELFTWRVQEVQRLVYEMVHSAKEITGAVDLYAASTKSSTLLQACGIDHRLIRQAVERTPEKWGRVTAGTRIPIISEEQWREDPSRITLVGAWQFMETFKWREAEYLADGGRFIVPLPQATVVSEARRATA
jgi:hypothetical protein